MRCWLSMVSRELLRPASSLCTMWSSVPWVGRGVPMICALCVERALIIVAGAWL